MSPRASRVLFLSLTAGAAVAVAGFAAMFWAERRVPDQFEGPSIVGQRVGRQYFLNDLTGHSPADGKLPFAFMVSHSARPGALAHPEEAVPAERFGLTQDPFVSGWGAVTTRRPLGEGGLSVQYLFSGIDVQFGEGASGAGERLRMRVPWPDLNVRSFGGVSTDVRRTEGATVIYVDATGPGALWVEPLPASTDGFPIEFQLENIEPSLVSIGADEQPAPARQFTLQTRDFHSVARGALPGLGRVLSIVRGGVRGRINVVEPDAVDVLLEVSTSRDVAARFAGFRKDGCPGRSSTWVDVDSDGALELYLACGRPEGAGRQVAYANRLFFFTAQAATDRAGEAGIDFAKNGTFRFIDWDSDGDPDLWWADERGNLELHRNDDGRFTRAFRAESAWRGGSRPPQLLVHDLGGDADPDLFLLHPAGSILVVNNGAGVELTQPSAVGLPDDALAGTWADVDLDGHVDLLTTSTVYRGDGRGRFSADPPHLAPSAFVGDARLVSYADGGRRRQVLALKRCLPSVLCDVRSRGSSLLRELLPLPAGQLVALGLFAPKDWFVYRVDRSASAPTSHREVLVVLEGSAANPDAIGARIELEWPEGIAVGWVGQSESSLYSMTDLAVSFSVPKRVTARGTVRWQENCTGAFEVPEQVHQVRVPWPASCTHKFARTKWQIP